MNYRKIIKHMECFSDVFPFADQPVRIYDAFCILPVKILSVQTDRIVCKHALLGYVPS